MPRNKKSIDSDEEDYCIDEDAMEIERTRTKKLESDEDFSLNESELAESDEEYEEPDDYEDESLEEEEEITTGKKRKAEQGIKPVNNKVKKQAKPKAEPKKPREPKVKEPKQPKVPKEKKPPKESKAPKAPKQKKELLSSDFDLNKTYFYQDLSHSEWEEVEKFVKDFLKGDIRGDPSAFFLRYDKIKKGEHNVSKLNMM